MWTVYLKELLELSRDRKALIFTILMPTVIMPLMFSAFGFATAMMMKKAQEEVLNYAVFGEENAPGLVRRFADAKGFQRIEIGSKDAIREAINNKTIKFALEIPASFPEQLAQHRKASLILHYNSASSLNVAESRVRKLLDAESDSARKNGLDSLGLSPETYQFVLQPIDVVEKSTADEREDFGEKIGGILPYILLIVCLTGAMYPAIDIGAGEKERGTLETLLLAPIPRTQLVMAKFLVLFTTGFITASLAVISIGVWAVIIGQAFAVDAIARVMAMVGIKDLILVVLMLVPVNAIFASLLLSLSIYAKSFKEAQNYMSPLFMVMFVPIVMAMLPGIELNYLWALVPLTNISLAIKELLKGTMHYDLLALIILSSTLVAAGLLAFCRWWFGRETVLFRS